MDNFFRQTLLGDVRCHRLGRLLLANEDGAGALAAQQGGIAVSIMARASLWAWFCSATTLTIRRYCGQHHLALQL